MTNESKISHVPQLVVSSSITCQQFAIRAYLRKTRNKNFIILYGTRMKKFEDIWPRQYHLKKIDSVVWHVV